MALIYLFTFKIWPDLLEFIKSSKIIQHVLNVITTAFFIYVLRTKHVVTVSHMNLILKFSYFWSLTLFFLLISSDEYSFVKQFFNKKLLQNWGKFSFGIYLFHPSTYKIMDAIVPNALFKIQNSYEQMFVISLIIYTIGFLFHILIEKNMTRLAHKLCKKINGIQFQKDYNLVLPN
jgi:peptidoglycan/LPS O-acetylase OafA/YrhL